LATCSPAASALLRGWLIENTASVCAIVRNRDIFMCASGTASEIPESGDLIPTDLLSAILYSKALQTFFLSLCLLKVHHVPLGIARRMRNKEANQDKEIFLQGIAVSTVRVTFFFIY
jgi:hypothetical protein